MNNIKQNKLINCNTYISKRGYVVRKKYLTDEQIEDLKYIKRMNLNFIYQNFMV